MNKSLGFFGLLVVAVSFALVGCIKDHSYDNSLAQSRIELKVGETCQLKFAYESGYPQRSGFFGHSYYSDGDLDQYGDVYGVSGNALDQDVLNDLKWTKIDKK